MQSKHKVKAPLSETLRPSKIDELVGQQHLVAEHSFLRELIEQKKPLSILLWGPPGCGKTTLAKIYASQLSPQYHALSAVACSTTHIKELLKQAQENPMLSPCVIFLDEIHRFNKSQQDLFLPYIENGELILIGATTENPSFSLNNALLSRMRVFTLHSLTSQELCQILERYEAEYQKLPLSAKARDFLVDICQGDGRYLLNMIENLSLRKPKHDFEVEDLKKILQKRSPLFDKQGDSHYNLISALHKSVRGSDPDAAIYWLARILNGGEDPLYLARRMIRMASEDIGLADPNALTVCLNAHKSYQVLGSPEGELALFQAIIYLALAPKSNACYTASKKARQEAKTSSQLNPPMHILNAPTAFMRELGYGKQYQYDHDCKDQFSGQNYFPDDFEARPCYYQPKGLGQEREMKKRLDYFNQLRNQKNN